MQGGAVEPWRAPNGIHANENVTSIPLRYPRKGEVDRVDRRPFAQTLMNPLFTGHRNQEANL